MFLHFSTTVFLPIMACNSYLSYKTFDIIFLNIINFKIKKGGAYGMKKWGFLFVLVLSVFLISACGGSSETGGDGISEDGTLTIGETGLYSSTAGDFEVTLNSVKFETGEDGEKALRGTYVVANATVTSRASKAVNIEDVLPFKIFVDNVVNWNNVTAGTEFSFGTQISGEIKEGDSVTGEIIFDARESDTYKIMLGSKAETTKLEWDLTPDDFQ